MIVLGIESSCDETAAAVVRDGNELLSNVVYSSMDLHAAFGGVVPEIAARSHVESIIPVIDQAVKDAFTSRKSKVTESKVSEPSTFNLQPSTSDPWDQIDAIAVTFGAGLGGSLLVGVMTARTLAITKNKPLYAINHVEGHVYANFLTKTAGSKVTELKVKSLESRSSGSSTFNLKPSTCLSGLGDQTYQLPTNQPEFPILALIVSGGHSQLVLFRDHFDYTLLGQTRDDAIGEAFDKVAKITGLPYPGGPSIAEAAKSGDPYKYKLPKSKLDKPYEFSFSGVKTAVLRLAQEIIGEDYRFPSFQLAERLSDTQKHDIAASFQRVAIETVVDKTLLAYEEFQPKSVVIAGGVAANLELRRQLSDRIPIEVKYTDPKLCTDNGAMIATLGCFKAMLDAEPVDPYSLQIEPNLSM